VLALTAAWGATPRQEQYTAEATLFVGTAPSDTSVVGGEVSGDRQTGFSLLAATFTQMLESDPVASEALVRSGVERSVDDLLASIDAQNPPGTQLINVAVTDEDPTVAQTLADAVSRSFIDVLAEQEREQQASRDSAELSPVSLFAPARLPREPLDTGLSKNLLLATLFGTVGSFGLVVLLEYLDLTIRTPEDAERRIGLPVLGVLPQHGAALGVPGVRHVPAAVRGAAVARG